LYYNFYTGEKEMEENKIINNIDEELMLKLFRTSSPSNREDKVQTLIKEFLTKNAIDFKTDKIGNIFNLDIPDAPLLSSHMDTVEDTLKDSPLMKYVRIYDSKEYGKYIKGYGVIGGDDKCGVFINLSLLKKYPNKINFIFSINEEKGMSGIQAVVKEQDKKFEKILFGIVIDRRGAGDIICTDKNYGTKEFETEIEKIGADFGYKSASGAASDAGYISEKVSCANISAGYYNPHSKKEFVIIDDMINAMNYADKLIATIKTRFIPPVKTVYHDYTYTKRCAICFVVDSTYTPLRWWTPIKGWICGKCAGDIINASKDEDFIKFSQPKKDNFSGI
jgi:tripeptide aminopeptidase